VLGQKREFRRLDKLLLTIRVNDLGLIEVPLVCTRIELRTALAVRPFGRLSERAHACRVGREQELRMCRYQGIIFACTSRTRAARLKKK
jgi:hypothetical protein